VPTPTRLPCFDAFSGRGGWANRLSAIGRVATAASQPPREGHDEDIVAAMGFVKQGLAV
jgi:hypothetical protein